VLKPATGPAVTSDLYYIHADHLGTPRKITRPSDNKVVWTWESEAFGASLPDPNPSGLGRFVFNLRFPGQYFDAETGLHYNYFRDYDPATGRYGDSFMG
jgi:RHS repeat-associated protein